MNVLLILAGHDDSFFSDSRRQVAQMNGARRVIVDVCCLVADASRVLVLVDVRISVVNAGLSLQAGEQIFSSAVEMGYAELKFVLSRSI
jgi:hypothetical protein